MLNNTPLRGKLGVKLAIRIISKHSDPLKNLAAPTVFAKASPVEKDWRPPSAGKRSFFGIFWRAAENDSNPLRHKALIAGE